MASIEAKRTEFVMETRKPVVDVNQIATLEDGEDAGEDVEVLDYLKHCADEDYFSTDECKKYFS